MHNFFLNNYDLFIILIRLSLAVVLGMIIGAERLFVHKEAGMKTHALVALGSAVFMIISEALVSKYANMPGLNPAMIPSQIIVGIGFLGAGAIILQGQQIRGLTTAGGMWVTAGIGIAAGFGFYTLAIIATVIVFLVLTIVNYLEKPLRKIAEEEKHK